MLYLINSMQWQVLVHYEKSRNRKFLQKFFMEIFLKSFEKILQNPPTSTNKRVLVHFEKSGNQKFLQKFFMAIFPNPSQKFSKISSLIFRNPYTITRKNFFRTHPKHPPKDHQNGNPGSHPGLAGAPRNPR